MGCSSCSSESAGSHHNWSACIKTSSPTVSIQLASVAIEKYALTAAWLTPRLQWEASSKIALHAAESRALQQNHASLNLVAKTIELSGTYILCWPLAHELVEFLEMPGIHYPNRP